ncbi:MAG: helix-turn-helix domain-containing protein [Planctomycetota bacterium]
MAAELTAFLEILAEQARDRGRRVSLAELARQAGLSPSHFQRTFARLIGESPKQFVRRLQLEYAAAQLITTERSVLQVALDAGFESHEGYSRAFRAHFGRSPRSIRKAGVLDPEIRARHAALIQSIGPCVRLYRTSTESNRSPATRSRITMNYDITRQSLDPSALLCKEVRCTHAEIAQSLAECLPAAFAYATQKGIPLLGPPTTRYADWGPGVVTLQGGVPVPPGSEPGDGLMVVDLPAIDAAVTVHTGSYDGLGDAHAALETYLLENGLESGGPAIEIYLTDPGEVPDPAEWKTMIQKPIARS